LVAAAFDERDPAVTSLISTAIKACKARGKYVGICGQGPSDHPDLAEWLLDQGIDSISLNPDTVVDTWIPLGRALRPDSFRLYPDSSRCAWHARWVQRDHPTQRGIPAG
jgi:pyruvate,water dikinase